MSACRRHYPGRPDGTDSLITAPSSSAFPRLQLGRLLHYQFRGLLSVHSRYNLQTRQVALCDPLHRRLRRPCCLRRRSDCYRVERSSSRAGLFSRCGPVPFTAHCNRDVTPVGHGASPKEVVTNQVSLRSWTQNENGFLPFLTLTGLCTHRPSFRFTPSDVPHQQESLKML